MATLMYTLSLIHWALSLHCFNTRADLGGAYNTSHQDLGMVTEKLDSWLKIELAIQITFSLNVRNLSCEQA